MRGSPLHILAASSSILLLSGCQTTSANAPSTDGPPIEAQSAIPDGEALQRYMIGESAREFISVRSPVIEENYWYGPRQLVGDFNSDGYADYLLTGVSRSRQHNPDGPHLHKPILLFGTSQKGRFEDRSELLLNPDNNQIGIINKPLISDFNGDGVPDFFLPDTSWGHGADTKNIVYPSYYLSQEDGTWIDVGLRIRRVTSEFGHGGAVGDIDNDGDTDVVQTGRGDKVICFINDGRGNLAQRTCGNGKLQHSIALGDWDGDGDLDMMTTWDTMFESQPPDQGHAPRNMRGEWLWYNDGRGNFTPRTRIPDLGNCWNNHPYLWSYDIDNDGDHDVIATVTQTNYAYAAFRILENQNGNFTSHFYPILEEKHLTANMTNGWQFARDFEVGDDCRLYVNGEFDKWLEGHILNGHTTMIRYTDVDKDGHRDIVIMSDDWSQPNDDRTMGSYLKGNSRADGFRLVTRTSDDPLGNPVRFYGATRISR